MINKNDFPLPKQENPKLYMHLATRSKDLTLCRASAQHSFRQDNEKPLIGMASRIFIPTMKNLPIPPTGSLACPLLVIV
ncbi:hypothetical protein C798_01945 [Herbaspirillum rubrisubalbicans Os34]|uniref:Uncharacterized protein n=1 Tax=Herbaspirillum rubrisubalbicans Os34 TaxID=1235827 RepID=A0A6M3ZK28_9BURK|nr:hypothetical protein C798_01945 [Herbaspirillum rubrisubalbicans Os34]